MSPTEKSLLALAALLLPLRAAADPRPPVPHYDHIFVIVEENQGLADILGKPFTPRLTALAKTYGVATQYYGIVHPSEGNYVAMLGGDTFGIHDDDGYFCKPHQKDATCKDSDAPGFVDHTITKPNLADQLRARGISWKGYYESLPSPGAKDIIWPLPNNPDHLPTALYASKHNAFNAFATNLNDPDRATHIVDFKQLDADLASGNMPAFAHIVPNQCNEMHGVKGENVPPDCTKENEPGRIARGDAYAGKLIDRIMQSPVWSQRATPPSSSPSTKRATTSIPVTPPAAAPMSPAAWPISAAAASPPSSSPITARVDWKTPHPTITIRCCARWRMRLASPSIWATRRIRRRVWSVWGRCLQSSKQALLF